MQASPNPSQPIVIYNTNTNVNTNAVVAQGSGMSRWSIAYLWMFGLGFITFGMTWLIIPVFAVVHLIAHLSGSSSATADRVHHQLPPRQANPNELAGNNNRAYVVRVLDLAFSGGFIDSEEYAVRAFRVPTARLLGDLDRIIADIPEELRHKAWNKR